MTLVLNDDDITLHDIKREIERRKHNQILSLFPETGGYSRFAYGKHCEFFAAGKEHRERIFIAANRVGKTVAGGYELVCHLTGVYPAWWEGKRFDPRKPLNAWCAGDTGKTTRDILQRKLLGENGQFGTGLIPKSKILRTLAKVGVPDAIEVVYVQHVSGGRSMLTFKSFDQRREGFQGTEQDVIWLDEEPPLDVYTECLLRTMTTNGVVYITFTPLMGLSEVVMSFCPGGEVAEGQLQEAKSKYVVACDWDAVPHLSQTDKDELLAAIPPYQRDARSRGLPQLGSGAIYQVPEHDILVDDFEIPAHFYRSFALDVGWNRTAAIWGAEDRDTNILYIYSEHYRGQAEPAVHAQAIKARGEWIKGVIDPAARGRTQTDGSKLLQIYKDLGINVQTANNSVEAGIYAVWERLSAGKIKIFRSLDNLRKEYRVYRRDEKGRIVKENDHLMDAMRYLVMSGIAHGQTKPLEQHIVPVMPIQTSTGSWMVG